MFAAKLPQVKVTPQVVAMAGGLDTVSTAAFVKPGSLQFVLNYEPHVEGGYERIGGIERFSGQPRPSEAKYLIIAPATTFSNSPAVGDAVNGLTSGATAKIIYVNGYIVVTKVVGTFQRGETIRRGTTVLGVYGPTDVPVTADFDNQLHALAANDYRLDIGKVPGTGPIRGVEVLNGTVYAWRDDVAIFSMKIYKSTSTGWQVVPLYQEVSFTGGTLQWAEGSTISQGGNTATVKRVVLESGTWAAGTAAGRLIITAPTGFLTGGAAGGGGAATLTSGNTPIVLQSSGLPEPRLSTRVYNFTGAAGAFRIYGCDGLNREFEFDGDVLVPLATGMGTRRATHVFAHKQHLFFAYGGSLQHSAVGFPYQWSPVVGAQELGIGDQITGFAAVGGSESSAALMIFAADRVSVLYGSGASTWQLVPISDEAGANAYSVRPLGSPLAHDNAGFRLWNPTQAFGNFVWELASNKVESLVKNKGVRCSVVSKTLGRYRCFFNDGTAVTGVPRGSAIEWTSIDYGRVIVVACDGEIGGVSRTFYGDTQGWIYEADVGRSFDGDDIQCALKLLPLIQGSTIIQKQYRYVDIEVRGQSAFGVSYSAEFDEGDPEATAPNNGVSVPYPGRPLYWDIDNWDQSYWDFGGLSRRRLPVEGQGYAIQILLASSSAVELPHKVNAMTITYTPRRMLR